MIQDGHGLPIAGGALVAALLYGLTSAFVTGPLVGARLIDKADWAPRCEAGLHVAAARRDPPAARLPKIGCNTIFGIFGRDGDAYCAVHGHRFGRLPGADLLDQIQTQAEDARRKRLEHAASEAGTRCACAKTTLLEDKRIAFALHAGSLRLLTPPAVESLDAQLARTLASPACSLNP
ncbi:hypothetical protein LC092_03315 [Stappia stellulata]|uniref:hypothetical protein n=1 Tax=Stappia stellulata TaxID=71235 RepID=UPI001CD42C38|nr:hypothetical protein [Stappia stellulata]MCA1241462.1 hypothetical protein [Stappia stellulata]